MNKPLEKRYLIVYIDALWEKVKRDTIHSEAFYIIMGLKQDYAREIIEIINIPTESSVGWE